MPDHPPRYDWETLQPEVAGHLKALVAQQSRLQLWARFTKEDDSAVSVWAKLWMQNQRALERTRTFILAEAFVIPWTLHVAGAPGRDEDYACDDEECENEWCGMVQKCSRCHDVLCLGYTGLGFFTETATEELYGRTLQGYLHDRFGDNPIDPEGPTWFPLGTQVIKRQDPEHGHEVIIVSPQNFQEEVFDCIDIRDELAEMMLK